MPILGHQKLQDIRRELLKVSNEENKLKEDKVTRIIKNNAGFSDKTVSKYWRELKEMGYVSEIETGIYEVKEIERETPELSGEKTTKNIRIDKEIKRQAEELGIDYETVLTEAILEQIDKKKEFLIEHGLNLAEEEEAEIVFELVKQDAYKHYSAYPKKEKQAKENIKVQIYKDVYNLDTFHDTDHLTRLREKAFDLATILGKEKEPKESFR